MGPQRRQHPQPGRARFLPLQQHQEGRLVRPRRSKAQALGLYAIGAHGADGVGQALRPLAQAQTAAVSQQPARGGAHIVQGAGFLMPGKGPGGVGAVPPSGKIRGIAGHGVQLQTRPPAAQIGAYRRDVPRLRGFRQRPLQQRQRVRLQLHGPAGAAVAPVVPAQRHDAAASAKVADGLVPLDMGKMGQQQRILPKTEAAAHVDCRAVGQNLTPRQRSRRARMCPPVQFVQKGSALGDGAHRARTGTGAAGDASIRIDLILVFALMDRGNGAFALAGAAGDTRIANYISHKFSFLFSARFIHLIYPGAGGADRARAAAWQPEAQGPLCGFYCIILARICKVFLVISRQPPPYIPAALFLGRRLRLRVLRHGRALAAAQVLALPLGKGLGAAGGRVLPHAQRPRDHVGLHDHPRALGRFDDAAHAGRDLVEVFIGGLLVHQAAHQPPAGAADLGRVQGEALLLGHFDGNGLEVLQKTAAAKRLAANAQAAQHARLVAHADLAQLDAGAEGARQIFYQVPEIDAAVGREVKQDLGAVQRVLHVHQLHIQLMLGDALFAHGEGVLFVVAVFLHPAHVHGVSQARHGLQRLDDAGIRHFVHAFRHLAALRAAGCFHDDVVALAQLQRAGAEIIQFARLFKTDADHFGHEDPFRCRKNVSSSRLPANRRRGSSGT